MSESRPRPGEPLRPLNRTFAAVLFVQTLDVVIHAASGMLEPLRVTANAMLVVDVCSDAEVADLREIVHDLCGLLDVVFLASHGDHLAVIRAT